MAHPVRLAGHGVAVLPRHPFALERHGGRGGDAVVVTHRPGAGLPQRVVLAPVAGGGAGCRVEPGRGVGDAEAVCEVRPGPTDQAWRIEAGGVSMAWPEGFVVQSSPAPERSPGFDLVAPGGVLCFAQGPLPAGAAPAEGQLAGPGHRLDREGREGGLSWVELTFHQELVRWRARHCVIPLGAARLLLTIQAPEASTETPAWRAAVEAARTVRRA